MESFLVENYGTPSARGAIFPIVRDAFKVVIGDDATEPFMLSFEGFGDDTDIRAKLIEHFREATILVIDTSSVEEYTERNVGGDIIAEANIKNWWLARLEVLTRCRVQVSRYGVGKCFIANAVYGIIAIISSITPVITC